MEQQQTRKHQTDINTGTDDNKYVTSKALKDTALDFYTNGVAINQAYDETLGGALQVNGNTKVSGSLNIIQDFGVQLNNNDTAIRIGEINSTNLRF